MNGRKLSLPVVVRRDLLMSRQRNIYPLPKVDRINERLIASTQNQILKAQNGVSTISFVRLFILLRWRKN